MIVSLAKVLPHPGQTHFSSVKSSVIRSTKHFTSDPLPPLAYRYSLVLHILQNTSTEREGSFFLGLAKHLISRGPLEPGNPAKVPAERPMAGRCSCRRCCRWREASPSLATKRGQDAKGAKKFISSQATRGCPPRAMSIDPSRCTCWWVHVIQKRNGSDMAASQTALTYSLSLSLSLSPPAPWSLESSALFCSKPDPDSRSPKLKFKQFAEDDRRGRQEVGEAQALVVVLVGHEDVTHPFKHHPIIIIIIIMANHWTQLSSDRSARDPRQQRSGPGTYFVPSEAEEVQTQNTKLSDLGSPSVHTPLQNQF